MKTIHILATAHGTDSAEGRAAINLVRVELDDMLRAHGGSQHTQYQVHEAYVDVQSPNVDEAALALPKEKLCVIVPILLSTGFHTQVDLRRAAKNSGIAQVRIAEPLGPDASLAALQRARLEQAGWSPGAGMVVQGSAGSSRQDGREDMSQAAALLEAELGEPVRNGFVAAIDPKLADLAETEQPSFASPYLLAEGFFAGKMRRDIERVSPGTTVAAPLVNSHDTASARIIAACALNRVMEALRN